MNASGESAVSSAANAITTGTAATSGAGGIIGVITSPAPTPTPTIPSPSTLAPGKVISAKKISQMTSAEKQQFISDVKTQIKIAREALVKMLAKRTDELKSKTEKPAPSSSVVNKQQLITKIKAQIQTARSELIKLLAKRAAELKAKIGN